jgi:hypothetical protein
MSRARPVLSVDSTETGRSIKCRERLNVTKFTGLCAIAHLTPLLGGFRVYRRRGGFLDFRSAERAASGLDKWVTGNCSARDFADFVRSHAISRVYLALPISTAPRIEELLKELRDTTASVYRSLTMKSTAS